jgi:hypothetical protein
MYPLRNLSLTQLKVRRGEESVDTAANLSGIRLGNASRNVEQDLRGLVPFVIG